MTQEWYINEIKMALGAVENIGASVTDNTLGEIVNSCLNTVQAFITQHHYSTITYKPTINLEEVLGRKIDRVFAVYRGDNSTNGNEMGLSLMGGVFSYPFIGGYGVGYGSGSVVNLTNNATANIAAWWSRRQITNIMSTDLRCLFIKPTQTLMVSCNGNPGKITVDYTPIYNSVEEITDDFWVQKLRELCVARAKRIIGNYLGKYNLENAPWKVYSETLQADGKEEEAAIMQELKNSRYVAGYIID